MTAPESIICKPTPWFSLRALAMLLMFGVFAVLFYKDGSTGYREKNEAYYLHQAFKRANAQFTAMMNAEGDLTAEAWKEHAAAQNVALPEDTSVLPEDLKIPLPWPEVLHDYERMKSEQWNHLWIEYSGKRELSSEPPEKAFDAGKIREQWIVFWICVSLTLIAAFLLVRTLRRSIKADAEAITTQEGRRVAYSDLKLLDLRKWDTKGLAFADYEGESGKGRIRIDGLTYGGFKKENGEPAEQLMRLIRSRFSGEILEYATVADDENTAPDHEPG